MPEWKGKTAYFVGIDKARFKQKVYPGDVLMLETKIVRVKGPIGVGEATATVNGKMVCKAELTFAIGD
jgi:3-hydroxyacyl-[acyl-carrier-protein] dehydratase